MPRRRPAPASPSPHPLPPPDLHQRRLPLATLDGPWWRVFWGTTRAGGPGDPLLAAQKAVYRFDSPTRSYGVIYVAEEPDGALIETLGRGFEKRAEDRIQRAATLRLRHLAHIQARRPLYVVDLTGKGLNGIGADTSLGSGREAYATTQAWSDALYRHPQRPDGIRYLCRHDPSQRAIAIFGRARPALRATDFGPLVGGSRTTMLTVVKALMAYGYSFDDPGIVVTPS